MDNSIYLKFKCNHSFYGIEAAAIQEIVAIPRLLPPLNFPSSIVGLLNLHGTMVPVLNIETLLGLSPPENDSPDNLVIIIKNNEEIFGLIVREVMNIHSPLEPSETESLEPIKTLFDASLLHQKIIFLLNHPNAVRSTTHSESFQIDPKDQPLLILRAHQLMEPIENNKEKEPLIPYAVFVLKGHYFGIEPQFINECIYLNEWTPLPHPPEGLLGCLNFNGTALTLLDIWPLLNNHPLATKKESQKRVNSLSQALVLDLNQLRVGIIVDKLIDLNYFNLEQSELAAQKRDKTASEEMKFESFTKKSLFYGKNILNVLDMQKVIETLFCKSR